MLHTELDHLVVAAPSLVAGADYIHDTLGVETHPGGEHAGMGTHNCLVRLGETTYLEVIALNPGVPAATRKPLFGLDRRPAESPPALITWVARCNDLDAAVAASPLPHGDIVAMKRGTLDWRLTIPADGQLPADGIAPSLIQWNTGPHPAAALPDAGCSLIGLEGLHPDADLILEMLRCVGFSGEFSVHRTDTGSAARLVAHMKTPTGVCQLGDINKSE